jgi:ATP-dependent RNA helicase RhlE
MVPKALKRQLLNHVLKNQSFSRVIVFTRTKHGADRVSKNLDKAGISSSAIHGNKSQNARLRALDEFRDGKIRVLVATDVAARGIDVDGITHVINFDLPNEPESYVHRIGRTGRAKASGVSISFCAEDERAYLRDIEKIIKKPIPVLEDHPFHNEAVALDEEKPPVSGGGGGRGRGGNQGGNRGGGNGEGGDKKKFNRRRPAKTGDSKRRTPRGVKKQNKASSGNIRNLSSKGGKK